MLACALEDEKVMKAARKTTANWGRAWEQRVNELRASPALRNRMGRSHVHRTTIGITRAMVAKNDTFRTCAPCRCRGCLPALTHALSRRFLAEPLDGLQRWQSALEVRGKRCPPLLTPRFHSVHDHGHPHHQPVVGQHLDVLCQGASRALAFIVPNCC